MAELAEALDDALRARYRVTEVRTPVTQRRGLLARMNQLEKLHARPGDTPTQTRKRAAEAAGIPDRTWRDWRNGTHPPSARNTRKLEGAYNRQITLPAFRRALRTKKVPGKVNVTAVYQWSGSTTNQSDKNRTVKMRGMRSVMAETIRAWAAAGPQAGAEAFERGAAQVYGADSIEMKGDEVVITFPDKD